MKKLSIFIVSALVTLSAVSSVHAIAGVGFHWGFDYSLSMDGVTEKVNVDLPSEVLTLLGDKDFITVSRTGWKASPINFGGKAYIDMIPFIEAIEISCNFGLWQYDGLLNYATFDNTGFAGYKSVDLTVNSADLDYVGLKGTPYAKLQLDATVRKTIVDFWIVQLSGGAGFSSHFSTPLLSAELVNDVIGTRLSDPLNTDLAKLLGPGGAVSKDIVKKIIDEAMGKPVYGVHILLGLKAKLPVIPVGIYVDGKYMIPLDSKFGETSGSKGVDGFGLLVNAGLSLSI